jgi:hypothetical protein
MDPLERKSLVGANVQEENMLSDLAHTGGPVEHSTYLYYHKVCDMRTVINTTPVSIIANLLAFLLIFTSWTGWRALVILVGYKYGLTNHQMPMFLSIVNASAVVICVLLIVSLRYLVGPILNYYWRTVFSFLIVATAITAWEALETAIDCGIGEDAWMQTVVYGSAFGMFVILTFLFERSLHYDVIGHHLLTTN